MKNSKKPNLHTCKGGVQIVFSFTVYTKGVQKVYKDEFVHQLQICSPKKDESAIKMALVAEWKKRETFRLRLANLGVGSC